MKRGLLALLAGLVPLVAAPVSNAAPPKIGGFCTPTPSPGMCLSAAYQQSDCFERTKAYCAPTYEAEYGKRYSALPATTEDRVVPEGDDRHTPGTLTKTKVVPYDGASDVTGAPGTYAAFMYKLRYQSKKGGIPITAPVTDTRGGILGAVNPALTGPGGVAALPPGVQRLVANIVERLPLTVADPRSRWDASGDKIRSCEEYTYEKFYSFSKFEDLIAENAYRVGDGSDRRKIFQALSAATTDGYVHRRGPGFPAVFALAKDPDGQPRSALYVRSSFLPIDFYDRFVDTSPWAVISKGRTGYGSPVDPALLPILAAGSSVPGWDWEKHRTLGAAFIASTPSDRFAQFDSLKDRHLANVDAYDRFAHLVEVCTHRRLVGSFAFDKVDPKPAWCNDFMVHVWDGPRGWEGPISEYAEESASADAIRLGLAVTEADVMATLHESQKYGCLDAGPQACEWSPRDIINKLIASLRTAEEESYSKCIKFTGGDLTSPDSILTRLRTKDVRFQDGTPILKKGIDGTNSNFEFDLVYDAFKAWADELGYDRDPNTGLTVIGQTQQDQQKVESGEFGVQLDYLVGWRLDNYSADTAIASRDPSNPEYAGETAPRMCNAEAHVRGHAALTAIVLGDSQEVFGANANVDTNHDQGRMKADFRILGVPFYNPPESRGDLTVALTFAKSSTSKLVEVSGVVPIMGVPVTLRAGVSGTVGVTGSLSGPEAAGGAPAGPAVVRDCINHPDVVAIGVKGTFEPSVSVDGYASASIDLGFIEGGIKGELQLARLGMPLNVDVGIRAKSGPNGAPGPNGQGPAGDGVPVTPDFELYVKTGLDLTFSTMDGRVAMFLDSPFGSTERTLTSWQGLHYRTNVFSRESKVPLEFLTVVDKL